MSALNKLNQLINAIANKRLSLKEREQALEKAERLVEEIHHQQEKKIQSLEGETQKISEQLDHIATLIAGSSEKNHKEAEELFKQTQDAVRLDQLYKQEENRKDKMLHDRFLALKGHTKPSTDADLWRRLNNLKGPTPSDAELHKRVEALRHFSKTHHSQPSKTPVSQKSPIHHHPMPTKQHAPQVNNQAKRNLILAYKDLSSIVKTASAKEKLEPIFKRTSLLVKQSNQLQKQKDGIEKSLHHYNKMLASIPQNQRHSHDAKQLHQAMSKLNNQVHQLNIQIQNHNSKMTEFSQKLKEQSEKFRHLPRQPHKPDNQPTSAPRLKR